MGKAIPEGWLDYTPLGKPIEGTRFISFKVPLKTDQRSVAEDNRLSPNSLMELVPNLGLVIDLTDTSRYYDASAFTNSGVEHSKIRIPGRLLPTAAKHQEFRDIVDDFLSRNSDNDKLIGVHCTHGCNRTGLMICKYLVHNDDAFDAEKALAAFQTARGHEIHRDNYVQAIRTTVKGQPEPKEPTVPTNPTGNTGGYLSWRQQRQPDLSTLPPLLQSPGPAHNSIRHPNYRGAYEHAPQNPHPRWAHGRHVEHRRSSPSRWANRSQRSYDQHPFERPLGGNNSRNRWTSARGSYQPHGGQDRSDYHNE